MYQNRRRTVSFLLNLCLTFVSASLESRSDSFFPHIAPRRKNVQILLDVDNTLYDESQHGVECQIAQNIHRFVEEYCSNDIPERYTSAQEWADALHSEYGSTIHGLVRHWHRAQKDDASIHRLQELFYQRVYQDLEYSSLLRSANVRNDDRPISTGYSSIATAPARTNEKKGDHKTTGASTLAVRRLLRSIVGSSTSAPSLQLASNSPRHHVEKVLQALGLCHIAFSELYTPDHRGSHGDPDVSERDGGSASYPTKYEPRIFFRFAAFEEDSIHETCFLIDDSRNVLQAVHRDIPSDFMQTLHLTHHQPPIPSLLHAVATAMDWIPKNFTLDEARYLHSKNQVDAASIHSETFQSMLQELHYSVQQQPSDNITIVDIGAGILFMLRFLLQSKDEPLTLESVAKGRHVDYFAYEPNQALLPSCIEQLRELGFEPDPQNSETNSSERPFIFHRLATDDDPMDITVHLCLCDFRSMPRNGINEKGVNSWKPLHPPHLIVGCCFADLMAPSELISALLRTFLLPPPSNGTHHDRHSIVDHTLLYFPITFTGVTSAETPMPFGTAPSQQRLQQCIPSDTTAFHYYAQALQEGLHQHHLNVDALIATVQEYGGMLMQKGPSDWIVDPERHWYLWECLLYFFGTTAAPALQAEGWDAHGWLHRLRHHRSVLRASNVDLLFRLPPLGRWHWTPSTNLNSTLSSPSISNVYQEILFTGPRQVTWVERNVPTQLGPNHVRIQTECSLISSGTELKIFTGQFANDDNDEPLDTTIASFSEARMAYPLAYGYSLVGRIVECGANVDTDEWRIGQRVFTFAAHASQVIADASQLQRVPEDIPAEDAIFLPAVETAVSLVQDASVVLGENVAIFGQGLIGLLVTALMSLSSKAFLANASFSQFGTLTTFDVNPVRRAWSAALGASQALNPLTVQSTNNSTTSSLVGPFDVVIEVSGNGRALQMALDSTRRGGRVIVGSWYGHFVVPLQLGLAFHRSHITLRTSQVSDISADLSMRWSKARRFALTWALVRQLRPSRLISRRTTLEDAAAAYRALEDGTEVAVAFVYDKTVDN